jgi:signal transduction histidine kinase
VDFDTSDLTAFTDVIRDLRHRHKTVVPLFAKAAGGLRKMGEMTTKELDDWLDKIMTSRMGTEMLTAHYMKLLTDTDDNHIGLVDTQCDPRKICKQAIEHTLAQFEGQDVPNIKLQVHGDIEFSFISEYLLFMVEELLLNAVCATIAQARRRGSTGHLPDIHVTVCEDPRRIGIQISDKAGGIPRPEKRIWEYMFSTTPEDLVNHFREATPLSGPGMGLPMCRLYTQYLGGKMHLMSMPGIGTDVYIFLNRIDASGIVPPSIADP